MTIYKDDLIRLVSKKSGFTMKDLRVVYDSTIEVITECMKEGNDIELMSFIKFFSKKLPKRTVFSQITQEFVEKEEETNVKVKVSGNYKKLVNKVEE